MNEGINAVILTIPVAKYPMMPKRKNRMEKINVDTIMIFRWLMLVCPSIRITFVPLSGDKLKLRISCSEKYFT